MKGELLLKKISIGISFSQIDSNQLIAVLDKYEKYIHDVYFSPVENIKYQTRKNIYDFDKNTKLERLNELSKVLEYAQSKGVKINLTLNAHHHAEEQIKLLIYYNNLFNIDYITTFSSVAHLIKNHFASKHLICTYNEGIDDLIKLRKTIASRLFSTIVLGNSLLRSFDAFQLLNENNINVKLLLNNGCLHSCKNFCTNNVLCKKTFFKTLINNNINEMYAKQSVFPEELHNYYISSNLIDTYKLSTRPISYQKLDLLLESYIKGDSRSYISRSISNYHLFCRLGHFSNYYSQLNYNDIIQIKERLWKERTTRSSHIVY